MPSLDDPSPPVPGSWRERLERGLDGAFDEVLWLLRRSLRLLTRGARGAPESSGDWGERRACRYLRHRGLEIIERNYRVSSGEIDIVARERETLVFVEVKTTSTLSRVPGGRRLSREKVRRLRRAVEAHLRERALPADRWRLDGIVIEYAPREHGRRTLVAIRWYPALDLSRSRRTF